MTKLSERAMLANLKVGSWSGMLIDREVSEEVNESHSADVKSAGHYNKRIVHNKFLAHVNSKLSVARKTHQLLTLPWEDGGVRILSSSGYAQYAEQMRLHRLGINAAAKEFATGMQSYIDEARTRLGSMFNVADYPEEHDVKKRFYIDVEIKPVPESGDFRAKLGDETVKAIIKDIERRGDERMKKAVQDVYRRVSDVTSKMVERLREFDAPKDGKVKKAFRDSLVYNIHEVANLLPVLNITNDPALVDLQQQLLTECGEHSPEVLRSDAKLRKQTADAAERIYRKAKQFIG